MAMKRHCDNDTCDQDVIEDSASYLVSFRQLPDAMGQEATRDFCSERCAVIALGGTWPDDVEETPPPEPEPEPEPVPVPEPDPTPEPEPEAEPLEELPPAAEAEPQQPTV